MNKIRVGLLIDEFAIPYWEYKMIGAIKAGNYADIVLVVRKKQPAPPNRSLFAKLKRNINVILFKLYLKAENRFSKPEPDAFEEKDLRDFIQGVPVIETACIEKKFSDYLPEEDIRAISGYNVDVFIRMGFRILRGDILKTAKFGIWSYHHGDNHLYRGGPAGYWEYLKREKQVGSVLQILTEDMDGGEILYRSWSSVESSARKTLNNFFWKTARFIPRKLQELHELGDTAFMQQVQSSNGHLHFYSGKNYTTPGNRSFLKLFIPLFWQKLRRKCWKLFNYEQWIMLYAFGKQDAPSTSVYRYKQILPPGDRYWADPCVVYENGKHYIFFEEVIYDKKGEKGHLCVSEISRDGTLTPPVEILKRPYHLSYPFVFKHEGQYYLIPESEANNTVEIYQAAEFPHKWEFKMNLMEGLKAVDPTLYYKDNRFWLFVNIMEMEGASYSEELFLFSSDTLLSRDWKAHPQNPIVSDVRSARPAGKIFEHEGKLYRPSQDCAGRYGYATVISEITTWNDKVYREQKVSGITPSWDDKVLATHTLSFEKGLTMIDAVIKRRKAFFASRNN